MEGRLTPELFWEKFAMMLRDRFTGKQKNKAHDAYDEDNAKWTVYLRELLEKLGNHEFKYVVACEHWPKVDTKYFSKEGAEWAEWAVEAAIEYENAPIPAWRDEACKLMQLLAGLKIIITYYKKNDYDFTKELQEFQRIYDSRIYHQENDSWLLIFGPTADICDKPNDFHAFKFDGKTIQEITGSQRIFTSLLNER